MKVRSSTRATSPGDDRARKEFGRFSGLSLVKVPLSHRSWVSSFHSSCDPSHQWMLAGWQRDCILSTHFVRAGWVVDVIVLIGMFFTIEMRPDNGISACMLSLK